MNKAIRVYHFQPQQPLNSQLFTASISRTRVLHRTINIYDVKRGNVLNPESSQGLVATTVEQLQQSTS